MLSLLLTVFHRQFSSLCLATLVFAIYDRVVRLDFVVSFNDHFVPASPFISYGHGPKRMSCSCTKFLTWPFCLTLVQFGHRRLNRGREHRRYVWERAGTVGNLTDTNTDQPTRYSLENGILGQPQPQPFRGSDTLVRICALLHIFTYIFGVEEQVQVTRLPHLIDLNRRRTDEEWSDQSTSRSRTLCAEGSTRP